MPLLAISLGFIVTLLIVLVLVIVFIRLVAR